MGALRLLEPPIELRINCGDDLLRRDALGVPVPREMVAGIALGIAVGGTGVAPAVAQDAVVPGAAADPVRLEVLPERDQSVVGELLELPLEDLHGLRFRREASRDGLDDLHGASRPWKVDDHVAA